MSILEVTSSTSTPIVKFLFTLKEVVVIAFDLAKQSHELELLHIKYSKEVFALVDQKLIGKFDRRDLKKAPQTVYVEDQPLQLNYQNGEFRLSQCSFMHSESTRASSVEQLFETQMSELSSLHTEA